MLDEQEKKILLSSALFRNTHSDAMPGDLNICKVHRYNKGTYIFSREVNPRALGIIISGTAQVEKGTPDHLIVMSRLLQGDVFGAVSLYASSERYVTAIRAVTPVTALIIPKRIMDKLIRDGRVIRGYIGISGREIAPLHAQGGGIDQIQGIVVNDVAPDGPAAQAGIRANDVIISVNDKPAVSALETMDQVAEIRPGSEIPVVIMRDDKKITLHMAVQEYPATN